MITQAKLFNIIISGRNECYVKKSPTYNPYSPGDIYDWHFKLEQEQYTFTDSYRGFNPYSGVEYIFSKMLRIPIWSCDYIGYALENTSIAEKEIYGFLKKARSAHLLGCDGNLLANYLYEHGGFRYQTTFSGNLNALLQVEEIHFCNYLVGRQVSAGYFKQ
ncbi:hypothetical protein CEB3_c03020 [Peptococcaceae bacterium CEB3]|nr:hypothetical protein CEB3_c03020 [Peptococcaceae bacterium CEB3]